MKVKIQKTDGTVIELEGTKEEVSAVVKEIVAAPVYSPYIPPYVLPYIPDCPPIQPHVPAHPDLISPVWYGDSAGGGSGGGCRYKLEPTTFGTGTVVK